MPIARPPRIYHDKDRKQYYIRRKRKRIYFPVGISKKYAQKLALKQLQMEPRNRTHNTSINAQPLQALPGFTRRKYQDSPLVVSYGALQRQRMAEALKVEALKKRTEIEIAKEDAERKIKEVDKKLDELVKDDPPPLEEATHPPSPAEGAPAEDKKPFDMLQAGEPDPERKRQDDINKTVAGIKAILKGKGMEPTPAPENFKEQLERDGLYSDQIAEMMKKYKKSGFLGVIASDEIKHLIQPSMQFDRFGWVMNTDASNEPGEHWIAVFVDLRNEREIDYYDSFAEDPPSNFASQIKELIDSHDPPFYLKFKVNRIKQQAENSTLCGFHAMRFLIDRFHGKPFKACTGYSEVKSAEKQAGKMAKKYDKFGYI